MHPCARMNERHRTDLALALALALAATSDFAIRLAREGSPVVQHGADRRGARVPGHRMPRHRVRGHPTTRARGHDGPLGSNRSDRMTMQSSGAAPPTDRKSTRLNSSHVAISYA